MEEDSPSSRTIRPFYAQWEVYNRQFIEGIRNLTAEQLAIRPSADGWPLWATVGHTAGARTYWLCGIFGEPGAEQTPFPDSLSGIGWEDDLDHPRTADELVLALETTWRIIDRVLDTWTPEMLQEPFSREYQGTTRVHSRQEVLMRMISHDAYHAGALSQILGANGLEMFDLWPPPAV
jgi:uncharacterized damage-inducible protein DinB